MIKMIKRMIQMIKWMTKVIQKDDKANTEIIKMIKR